MRNIYLFLCCLAVSVFAQDFKLSWSNHDADIYKIYSSTNLQSWSLVKETNSFSILVKPQATQEFFLVTANFNAKDLWDISLEWQPSPSSNVTGYFIYWGTNSGTYLWRTNVENKLQTVIPDLKSATKYYFSATAYEADLWESEFSNEVEITTSTNLPAQKIYIPSFLERSLTHP